MRTPAATLQRASRLAPSRFRLRPSGAAPGPVLMSWGCTGICVSCRNASLGHFERETGGKREGLATEQAIFGRGWFHAFGQKLQKCKSAKSGGQAIIQPHRSDMGASDSEVSRGNGGESEAPYRMSVCVTLGMAWCRARASTGWHRADGCIRHTGRDGAGAALTRVMPPAAHGAAARVGA